MVAFGHCFREPIAKESSLWSNHKVTNSPGFAWGFPTFPGKFRRPTSQVLKLKDLHPGNPLHFGHPRRGGHFWSERMNIGWVMKEADDGGGAVGGGSVTSCICTRGTGLHMEVTNRAGFPARGPLCP